MMKKFLGLLLMLLLCMGFVCTANAATTYITDIAVSYGKKSSTAEDLLTDNGYTIVKWWTSSDLFDFNDSAGGHYVYMGYKTSTSYNNAITGMIFRTGENPPESITHNGSTFYLLGGSKEKNGSGDGKVDLNVDAGGDYIYTYITRDLNYGPVLTGLFGYHRTAADNSDENYIIRNQDNAFADVNSGTDGGSRYLFSRFYLDYYSITPYYIFDKYTIYKPTYRGNFHYEGHEPTIVYKLSDGKDITPPTTPITYKNGYTYTLYGWSTSNYDSSPEVLGQLNRVTKDLDDRTWYAIYSRPVKISFNANGGSRCSQDEMTAYAYENVYGHIDDDVRVPAAIQINQTASHSDPCKQFLGWSTNKNATKPDYNNDTYAFINDTTLYAVWKTNHSLVSTPAKAESCEEAGNSAYKTCTRCGKYFNANNQEIAKDSWVIPAQGHKLSYALQEGTTNVCVEDCANCTHTATATLTTAQSEYTYEPGRVSLRGELVFSDNWIASKEFGAEHKNHINAGTATVTSVIAIDPENIVNLVHTYIIRPADLSNSDVLYWPDVYNGAELTATVYWRENPEAYGGVRITEGEDYAIVWDKETRTEAGDYTCTITGIGNFTGSLVSGWTVRPAGLTDVSVVQTGMDGATPTVETSAAAVNSQPVTFVYSTAEDGPFGEMPAFGEAGEYTVYYKASAPNHNEAAGSFMVSVAVSCLHNCANGSDCTVCGKTVSRDQLTLPAALAAVEAEAFSGTAAEAILLPEGVVGIGERAFAGSESLRAVIFTNADADIAANALEGSANAAVVAPAGGTVELWAEANGVTFVEIQK